MSLFDRRFIVMAGKGGVGRTTVAAALARAAADRGKRVLLAQTESPDRLHRLFGRVHPVNDKVAALAPRIDAVNMTPRSALHEYGLLVMKLESLVHAVFENRTARGFLAAVPGLDAYAMLGKAWWHTTETTDGGRPKYDLVILDGPATGHVVQMLRIPQAILDSVHAGPLLHDALAARDLIRDPVRAAMFPVTLPEETPAREAVELVRSARELLHIALGPLVVNAMPSDRLADPDVTGVLERLHGKDVPAELAALLDLAASERRRAARARDVQEQLRAQTGLPLIPLPRLPTVALGPAEVARLAETLGAALDRPPGP